MLLICYLAIALIFGLLTTQLVIRDSLREKRDAEQYALFLKAGDEIEALCLAIRYNQISVEDLWSSDDRMPVSISNLNTKASHAMIAVQIIGSSLVWPVFIVVGATNAFLHWRRERAFQLRSQ